MSVKAAVQTGDRKIEIQTLSLPPDLAPGEALLEVEGCGICGSDVSQYEGVFAASSSKSPLGAIRYPTVPGHEPVGKIAQITPEAVRAWNVNPGDRVAVHPVIRCGRCRSCQRGTGTCVNLSVYGHISAEVGSGLHGGFAQYLHLRPESLVFKMASDLPVEDAVFYNPLSAGFSWAVDVAGTKLGDTVLILGPGQRGLSSVIGAHEAGAATIIVTGLSRDEQKLQLARELGATHLINAEKDDVVAAVHEITHGKGVDRVIDVTIRRKPDASAPPMPQRIDLQTTNTEPVNVAVSAAAVDGTVVLAGLKAGEPIRDFPVETVILRRLHLRGAGEPSAWSVEQAIRAIESRRYPLEKLHTHTITIDDLERGIQMLAGEIPDESPIHLTITPG